MDYLIEPSRAPRPRPENVIVKAFSEDAPPTPNRFATEASRSEHEQADLVLVPCRPGRFGNCREFVAVGTDGRSGGLPGGPEGFEPLTPAVQAPARFTAPPLPVLLGLLSKAHPWIPP
jgi:hypothetical protein